MTSRQRSQLLRILCSIVAPDRYQPFQFLIVHSERVCRVRFARNNREAFGEKKAHISCNDIRFENVSGCIPCLHAS